MVLIKKQPKKGKQLLFQIFDINWEYETKRIIKNLLDSGSLVAYIDLFCGSGGTTTGVAQSEFNFKKFVSVILGINHDRMAIASHQANHPETLHLIEDVREVNLIPIAKLVADIRREIPYIKIILWASCECVHFSRAKGGDSRSPDSRSLAEELYRYDEAIRPDMLQVENVSEFRTWGPLHQKRISLKDIDIKKWPHRMQHPEHGRIYSNDRYKKNWFNIKGFGFKKEKKEGITPWMVPIPERKAEYFNAWVEHLKELGFTYDDKDINSADLGAYTTRKRYYGQAARNGMPIIWPVPTHAKDPAKYLRLYGKQLQPYKPVREVLNFEDKGDSVFVPDRINSPMTYKRINEGGIKFIAGGREKYQERLDEYMRILNGDEITDKEASDVEDFPFIQNFHGGGDEKGTRVHSVDEPSRTLDTQNRYAFTNMRFLTKHFSGHPASKSSSLDTTAGAITTIDHHSLVVAEVLPFIVQFNNNCDARNIDEPLPTITLKEKFALSSFIQQRNSGNPAGKVASVDSPARTVTATGGNQELVQVLPFIFRQFGGGGGHSGSIDTAVGALMTYPKVNIISPESWIMGTSYDNIGRSVKDPAPTQLASRKHDVVNPSWFGNSHDIEQPSPVIVASQDKAPLHLVQVEYEPGKAYHGIAVYESDCEEIRELKLFMAVFGIKDIRMRMLLIPELLAIQGFPPGYLLKGSQTDRKKFIGNSVEVKTARSLAECYGPYLASEFEKYLLTGQKMVG